MLRARAGRGPRPGAHRCGARSSSRTPGRLGPGRSRREGLGPERGAVREQGKGRWRTSRLPKSRERSLLVPVSLTHPTRRPLTDAVWKGCCCGAFSAAHRFLLWFGGFLKENGNEISLKEIEDLPLLLREQKLFFFFFLFSQSKAATSNLEFLSLERTQGDRSPAGDPFTYPRKKGLKILFVVYLLRFFVLFCFGRFFFFS